MRALLRIMIFVALVLGAKAALEGHGLSAFATHRLTAQCAWAPLPWARLVGFGAEPTSTAQSRDARYRCWLHRGLKGRIPAINDMVASWPSKGEPHAQGVSLSAGEDAGHVQGGDRRRAGGRDSGRNHHAQ